MNGLRKQISIWSLTVLLVGHPIAKADSAEQPILLVTNNWCPQHCIQHSIGQGYLVEIVQEALSAAGMKTSVTFKPWLRAIKLVKLGEYDGLLTPSKSEEEDLLRHAIPLASQRFCFYQHIEDKNALTDLTSFRNRSIAFVNGNNLGSTFMSYIGDAKNNVRVHKLTTGLGEFAPRIFRFLIQRRVDAIAITEDMGDFYLGEHQKDKSMLKKSYCTSSEELHVGLSPANKERSVMIGNMIDIGLKRIRDSGTYQRIMKKYHQLK